MTVRTLIKKLSKMPQNAKMAKMVIDSDGDVRYLNLTKLELHLRHKGDGGLAAYTYGKHSEEAVVFE